MGQPSYVGVSLEEFMSDVSDFSGAPVQELVDNSEKLNESVAEPVSTVETQIDQ